MEDWHETDGAATVASLKQYLWSIVYMPAALRSANHLILRRSYKQYLVPQVAVSHQPVLLELPRLLQSLLHGLRGPGRVRRKPEVGIWSRI